jgi:hypothetical protein
MPHAHCSLPHTLQAPALDATMRLLSALPPPRPRGGSLPLATVPEPGAVGGAGMRLPLPLPEVPALVVDLVRGSGLAAGAARWEAVETADDAADDAALGGVAGWSLGRLARLL